MDRAALLIGIAIFLAVEVKSLLTGESADPEVLDVTVETLRGFGWEVLTAPDGPSALSVLRRDADIDVLFTDIVMPRGMNGLELARQARRLRPELRVLLASGYPASVLASDHGTGDDGEFPFLAVASLPTDVVLGVRPVDPDEGRKFNVRMWLHDFAPAVLK